MIDYSDDLEMIFIELPKFTKNEAPHVNPEDVNFIRATSLDLGKSKMSIDEGGLDLRETLVLCVK